MSDILSLRLDTLRQRMQIEGSELLAVSPGTHMLYLLGFHPHADERPCLLLISASAAVMLCPALSAGEVMAKSDIPLHCWADEHGPEAALTNALVALDASDCQHVALDETMRADFALLLLGALPAAKHSFSLDTLGWMRMHKDKAEYQHLKMNALIDDRALLCAAENARAGMTERELADVIRAAFAREGAATEFVIVAAGANGAHPHHTPSDYVIQPGDVIVTDIGGRKDGFPSDMTRMIAIGEAPAGYAEVHAVVEAAVQAALRAAQVGARACDVDAAAREVISAAGYGEYFTHRTGHGLGLDIHEPPYITATSQVILQPGMVFSIEPGVYLPGRFGIRLEEIVILREDGPEILSELPRKLIVSG